MQIGGSMIVDINGIELGTGMKYDGETSCFTGIFSGYTFALKTDSENQSCTVTTWVTGHDGAQSISSFLDAFSSGEASPLLGYRHINHTVILYFGVCGKKAEGEEIASAVQHFAFFLSSNYYRPCCFGCGETSELSLIEYDGKICQLCGDCKRKYGISEVSSEAGFSVDEKLDRTDYHYVSPRSGEIDITANQHRLFELKRELEKKSNIVFGITGALAGTLISTVLWIILGQSRFIPLVAPIAMGLLCGAGYRFCGGILDTRGIVSCSVLIALFVPLSSYLSMLLTVLTEIDAYGGRFTLSVAMSWFEEFCSIQMYSSSVSIDIFLGYVIAATSFVAYAKSKYQMIIKH